MNLSIRKIKEWLIPEGDEIIIIFGRRCGTSTLAKALMEKGYCLPGPLDTREMPSNLQGHYENVYLRTINASILAHHALHPHIPGLCPFVVHPKIAAWSEKHPGRVIVKEPNINLTWPVWVRTLKDRRKLRGIWCRRDLDEQIASLKRWYTNKRFTDSDDNWYWCAKMYEASIRAAKEYIPMREVWLSDPDRVEKAVDFIHKEDVLYVY